MYVNLGGFVTRLNANLAVDDRHLPIPAEAAAFIRQHLKDSDHTFLELRDGKAIEFVKITNVCGKLVIDRGVEQTKATAFRCGTGISFQLTMQAIKDTICQLEGCK